MKFIEELRQQRWDDHRYYHHNRINQFLHLLSAVSFLASYVLIFINPVIAIMAGWLLAMVLRQTGHFFFEPKTYDRANHVSHEYKENVKVGYNLSRKIVLLSIWAVLPVLLYLYPTFFGMFETHQNLWDFIHSLSVLWLIVGAGALLFRTIHLFFIMGIQSALVWAAKIMTDPFHDIKIYYKSPYYIMKGEMYDEMKEWYIDSMVSKTS